MVQTVIDDAVRTAAQAYAAAVWTLTEVRHHDGCYGWGLRRRRVPFPREPRRSRELEETRQHLAGALEAVFPQRVLSLSHSFTPDGEWALLVAIGRRIDVQVGWTRNLRAPEPAINGANGADELDLFHWPTVDLRRIRDGFTSLHAQEVTGLGETGPRGVRELHITNTEIDCQDLAGAAELRVLDADRARLRHAEALLELPELRELVLPTATWLAMPEVAEALGSRLIRASGRAACSVDEQVAAMALLDGPGGRLAEHATLLRGTCDG